MLMGMKTVRMRMRDADGSDVRSNADDDDDDDGRSRVRKSMHSCLHTFLSPRRLLRATAGVVNEL
jgi:hypothetical protein